MPPYRIEGQEGGRGDKESVKGVDAGRWRFKVGVNTSRWRFELPVFRVYKQLLTEILFILAQALKLDRSSSFIMDPAIPDRASNIGSQLLSVHNRMNKAGKAVSAFATSFVKTIHADTLITEGVVITMGNCSYFMRPDDLRRLATEGQLKPFLLGAKHPIYIDNSILLTDGGCPATYHTENETVNCKKRRKTPVNKDTVPYTPNDNQHLLDPSDQKKRKTRKTKASPDCKGNAHIGSHPQAALMLDPGMPTMEELGILMNGTGSVC